MYGNLAAPALRLRNRNGDFQNSIGELCVNLFRIDAFRQRNCPVEMSVVALTAVNAAFLRFVTSLPFS
jgi:hypothetical protein